MFLVLLEKDKRVLYIVKFVYLDLFVLGICLVSRGEILRMGVMKKIFYSLSIKVYIFDV